MNNINQIYPCKNNVGAFIDLDLNSVNVSNINIIKDAINDYGVLFFRNQNLSSKNYIKFSKNFGKCANYPMLKGLEDYPEITVVEKKPEEKLMFGEGWHTDSTYTQKHVVCSFFCFVCHFCVKEMRKWCPSLCWMALTTTWVWQFS